MKTDFFDDDLLSGRTRPDSTEDPDGVPVQALSDTGLTRLVRQREDLHQQVAQAVSEIERLRSRQQMIEKEKSDLEELSRLQADYQAGKDEIIGRLRQSMVLFEKEEGQASRMAELLSVMRGRFSETLNELRAINESEWSETEFATDLRKAMVLVEDAKKTYQKALSKIDAEGWQRQGAPGRAAALADELPHDFGVPRGFLFWLKAGLAFSIPLGLVLIALFTVWLLTTGWV
jgi:TolA-binding protein